MNNDACSSGDPEYRGPYDEYLKSRNRRFTKLHLEAVERVKAKRAKQPEIQSIKEKIQQQLLTVADLKTRISAFQNTDSSSAVITNNITTNTNNPDALNVVEERYRTSLITNMIQLIHSKRKPV